MRPRDLRPFSRSGASHDDAQMSWVEIPEPVDGWNPVPGDPDRMVWWDGTTFTHDATRVDGEWASTQVPAAQCDPPPSRRRVGSGGGGSGGFPDHGPP